MKNILEILQENRIELSDEQSKAIEKATLENYKTVKDYENQTEKARLAEEKEKATKTAFDDFKKDFDGVDVEGMNKKIEELNTTLANKEKEYETEKTKSSLENAVKEKASELGCVDYDLLKSQIDFDALMSSKDQSNDIVNTLNKAKENKPILFTKTEVKKKVDVVPPTGGAGGNTNDTLKGALNEHYEGGN